MSCLKVICWALFFIFKLRFPPGVSIAIVNYLSRGEYRAGISKEPQEKIKHPNNGLLLVFFWYFVGPLLEL
jgi:hypothetical protein